MRLLNIASGSTGNSTYIGNNDTHLLIDAGISRKRILDALDEAEIQLSDINGILVTHEHIDHISSLGILERTVQIPLYATKGTIEGIKACSSLGSYDTDVFREIEPGRSFTVGDINIMPLSISHDAREPVCYRFSDARSSAAIVTDLGEFDELLITALKGVDILMLESNHDVRMLEAGPYPYVIKQRILGRYGHLSNEASGKLLAKLLHDDIKEILLAHISRENNTRELAKIAVETEIDMSDNTFSSKDFDLKVLRHDIRSDLFEV